MRAENLAFNSTINVMITILILTAFLLYLAQDGVAPPTRMSVVCNGTLIMPSLVLTGAHCYPRGLRYSENVTKARIANKLFLSNQNYMCSGTLIMPSWVLTAAHCYPNGFRETDVALGEQDLDVQNGSTTIILDNGEVLKI